MKYPKNRRSPVKHKVSGYKRKDGSRVSSYNRGSGRKTISRRSKVVRGSIPSKKWYAVMVEDSEQRTYTIGVHAYSDDHAKSIVVEYGKVDPFEIINITDPMDKEPDWVEYTVGERK